ncbi:MAG: aminotransferase class IV [Cyanobacteria bacterium]|nr:aminotransferase class IV [Cyanobacteriota bacterium]MDA1247032.1 aminotransferase class IV [Cyanobacteriota bacterium]
MSATAIAWLGDATGQGRWGTPEELALPVSDRGLLLADGLFETLLVESGQAWLMEEHLSRWQSSAGLLGLPPPPGAAIIQPLITAALDRCGFKSGALRLNWSSGSGARGIDPPSHCTPNFWLQLNTFQPCFEPVRVIVSPTETRSATSLLSRCKTFAYGPSIQARRQAKEAGADDALLPSSAGGLCCGSSANLLVCVEGAWITPPLSSGCLPGVMRQRGLESGVVTECVVNKPELLICDAAWLVNSLNCRPISHFHDIKLKNSHWESPETFWRRLLTADCIKHSKSAESSPSLDLP